MDKISGFHTTIDKLNKQISSINESMGQYVKNSSQMAKMLKFVEKNKSSLDRQFKKIEKSSEKPQPTIPKKAIEPQSDGVMTGKPSEAGVDYLYNPIFLKVAEYFGINQKEYPNAVNKIAAITDWAVGQTKSNKPSDIISHIAATSRTLPSPGYSERRYAILYRYVKLAEDQTALKNAIDGQKKPSENLQQEKQDIEKEMAAYQTT